MRTRVRALFGDAAPDELPLTADASAGRFENDLEALTVSEALIENYSRSAGEIAAAVASTWAKPLIDCGAEATCATDALRSLALPVARRPFEEETLQRYVGFYLDELSRGASPEAESQLVLEAALQSPQVLYRLALP